MPDRTSERGMKSLFAQKQCSALDVEAQAEAKRGQIEAALAEAINSQKKDADGIVMDSSSWVISGKNPA